MRDDAEQLLERRPSPAPRSRAPVERAASPRAAADPRDRRGRRAGATRSGTSRATISIRPPPSPRSPCTRRSGATAASAFVDVAAALLGERPDEGARVLLGLLVQRLRQVLALAADRDAPRPCSCPGAIAATSPARSRKNPADAACAPEGETKVATGTCDARIAVVISRVDVRSPPGVESSRTTSAAPSRLGAVEELAQVVRRGAGGSGCRSGRDDERSGCARPPRQGRPGTPPARRSAIAGPRKTACLSVNGRRFYRTPTALHSRVRIRPLEALNFGALARSVAPDARPLPRRFAGPRRDPAALRADGSVPRARRRTSPAARTGCRCAIRVPRSTSIRPPSFPFVFESLGPLIAAARGRARDDFLIAADRFLFGTDLTVWLERFVAAAG